METKEWEYQKYLRGEKWKQLCKTSLASFPVLNKGILAWKERATMWTKEGENKGIKLKQK